MNKRDLVECVASELGGSRTTAEKAVKALEADLKELKAAVEASRGGGKNFTSMADFTKLGERLANLRIPDTAGQLRGAMQVPHLQKQRSTNL